jgi:predicted nuclease of predicted toxin-antitoxin system
LKVSIDMNLSPEWGEVLHLADIQNAHWSSLGRPDATDGQIFDYARDGGWVIMTQDLDFAHLLFRTTQSGPSTILLRIKDELSAEVRTRVAHLIRQIQPDLEAGTLAVLDERRARLRALPLGNPNLQRGLLGRP